MIGSLFESKIIIELAYTFNQLEHRKKDLYHLACELCLTSSNIRDSFEDIRLQWEKRLSMNSEEIQTAEINMLILGFPLRCREIFKKDKCLEMDELDLLWQKLQQIEFIYIHKDQYLQCSVNQLAACILGGISVFIKFHQSWLDTYSERKQ